MTSSPTFFSVVRTNRFTTTVYRRGECKLGSLPPLLVLALWPNIVTAALWGCHKSVARHSDSWIYSFLLNQELWPNFSLTFCCVTRRFSTFDFDNDMISWMNLISTFERIADSVPVHQSFAKLRFVPSKIDGRILIVTPLLSLQPSNRTSN